MQKDIAEKYNAFETKEGNIVWCGTMCLTWQELAKKNGLKELNIHTKKKNTEKIADNLNKSYFHQDDISDKSIYVKCGTGPATLTAIKKEVKQKFPKCSFPDLVCNMNKSDLIAYAYLLKELTFKQKFSSRNDFSFRFNGKPTTSFYAQTEAQKKQIKMHYYENRDNFLISIADRVTNDVLYLLKNAHDLTVDQVIQRIIEWEKNKSQSAKKNDFFEMPVIDFDLTRSFKELIEAGFHDDPLKGSFITMMMEAIKLKVDESGAKVESRAAIQVARCRLPNFEQPCQFILDKTFWLAMKETKKHPYVCVQVKNPTQVQS